MSASHRHSGLPPVRVDLLGPLRLIVDGVEVQVPGPKRRALLAMLADDAGRAVPVDRLVEALWPGELPASARATLQSHVSRLRRHLGAAAGRLEGLHDAYRLRLEGSDSGTDVARARALLDEAKAAEPGVARRLLAGARALWRGPALVEFADVAPLAVSAVSLDALRRAVDEAAAAAAVAAGEVSEALELASHLVEADPHAEPGVLLLVRALDAAGRPAEALRAAHEHRRALAAGTGLDPSPALGELEHAILSRTPASRRVPSAATLLRGRDSELAALHRLVRSERLVTILGPGGIGKTRLATEIVARQEQAVAVWLAGVSGDALPDALAAALDLQIVAGDVLDACTAMLATGPHVVLLDGCEHVLAAASDVAAALLDACDELTIVATSREPLGLASEQQLRLSPLPVTTPTDAADLGRAPAVAVFVDRARRVRPKFALSTEDVRVIADIVRRLDGMPLAIELAASRLSSLGLADLRDRLDRALDLLADGRGTTLRQTIEWSYDLLPEGEQRLFRYLCVFPDGFDLSTAEVVAGGLDVGADATRALAHLVDASMVVAEFGAGIRYRMLDTIRAYGRDRLDREGELDAAVDGFAGWAVELAAWIWRTATTPLEADADRRLRREMGNLRAAWRLVRDRGGTDDAVQLVHVAEATSWRDLTEAWVWPLELAGDPVIDGHPDAAAVLGIAGSTAWSRGELDRAEVFARRGLGRGGAGAWWCDAALALVSLSRGRFDDAVSHGTRAAVAATKADQSLGVAALAAAYAGDLDAARAINEKRAQPVGSPTINAFHHYVAGEIDALAGRVADADAHYEHAIALARRSGATFVEGIASVGLLSSRARTGRTADALDGYRDLLDYWQRTGGWIQQWITMRNLALLLRSLGDHETAAFLDAAADHAPDAPPLGASADDYGLGPEKSAAIRSDAASATRATVLAAARAAIERHHATLV